MNKDVIALAKCVASTINGYDYENVNKFDISTAQTARPTLALATVDGKGQLTK